MHGRSLFSSSISVRALAQHPLDPVTQHVQSAYIERYGEKPEKPGGWYQDDDWTRISFVLGAMRSGGAVLDVGVGAGQFLNALALSGLYERVAGVDNVVFEKYFELASSIERTNESIGALPFPDDSFDVVTCMEVLEHIPDKIFESGLAELRRVCRGQLIMTVPFEEPEPISRFHVRRFLADDIWRVFPAANRILLDRPGMPWILMEEWPSDPGSASDHLGVRLSAVEVNLRIGTFGDTGRTKKVARLMQEVRSTPESRTQPTEEIARLEDEVRAAREALARVQGSIRYRVGTLMVSVARRPWRVDTLAVGLARLAYAWVRRRSAITAN